MKLGVYLNGSTADSFVEHARLAEEAGLESVWVGDHRIFCRASGTAGEVAFEPLTGPARPRKGGEVNLPFGERGSRTTAALEVLPDLVAGKPATVDGVEFALAPGSTVNISLAVGPVPSSVLDVQMPFTADRGEQIELLGEAAGLLR